MHKMSLSATSAEYAYYLKWGQSNTYNKVKLFAL